MARRLPDVWMTPFKLKLNFLPIRTCCCSYCGFVSWHGDCFVVEWGVLDTIRRGPTM
jgi:hypothetical protein